MPTRKSSRTSPKNSKRVRGEKHSKFGQDLIQGMKEAVAYMRGEIDLRTTTFVVPDDVDVKALRERSGLSQLQFAQRYCFNPRTLQEWEQGRAKPDMAVRAYLTVIDRNPSAVEKALHS
jgi:putative transcriptional regulator